VSGLDEALCTWPDFDLSTVASSSGPQVPCLWFSVYLCPVSCVCVFLSLSLSALSLSLSLYIYAYMHVYTHTYRYIHTFHFLMKKV
jgi:hypothetical protein